MWDLPVLTDAKVSPASNGAGTVEEYVP